MKNNKQDNQIAQLKALCQDIIDNAEKIVNSYDYQYNITITINFPIYEMPNITIKTEMVGQNYIDLYKKN